MSCDIPTLKEANTEDFLNIHKAHLELEKTKKNVDLVFLGDSITNFFDRNIFNKYFGEFNPLNYGICGDQTQHVLYRVNNGLFNIVKPKVVVLLIGINNIGNDPSNVANCILKIITTILEKTPNTKILLLSILPYSETVNGKERQYIKNVNEIIKNYTNNNIHYLDIGQYFINQDETLKYELYALDHLHISTKGYEVFADSIIKPINNLMKKKVYNKNDINFLIKHR